MKKLLPCLLVVCALPVRVFAEEILPKRYLGIDFGMPYTLTVDGNSQKARGNLNLGVDGRYFLDENFNLGARFSFDLQKKAGSARQLVFAPGVQYRWLTADRFSPYFQAGLPVILRGAANNAGSTGKVDLGISTGLGLAWNLGGAIGVPNTLVRYDFGVQYLFGLGSAVPVLGLELFKFGIEHRF